MNTIFLNTAEKLFLDHTGAMFSPSMPELTIGGEEQFCIYLKSDTPDWGTAAARPSEWPSDTTWSDIRGISAMLTVDDNYQKFVQAQLARSHEIGSKEISVVKANTDEIPVQGILKLFNSEDEEKNFFFTSRKKQGSEIIFTVEPGLVESFPEGTAVQIQQEPLAQAFIDSDQSDWKAGRLLFTLNIDSHRLRREVANNPRATIKINGIELLIYSASEGGRTQIRKAFLLDSATLLNVQGDPGFPADLPDGIENKIIAEIENVANSYMPQIQEGFWFVNGENTGVRAEGEKGDPMKIDATGTTAELDQYATEKKGFSFLDTDTGMVYFKNSDTSGDWSNPVKFAPQRGIDYWTEEDIQYMKDYVEAVIINGAW